MKTKYFLSLLFAGLLASCSLDYDPAGIYSDVTEGVETDSARIVFKDKAALLSHRQTLLNLFKNGQEHWYLDMLLLAESHSDNAYAGAPNAETTPFEVNSIEGSNTNMRRDWNGHMENIAHANRIKEKKIVSEMERGEIFLRIQTDLFAPERYLRMHSVAEDIYEGYKNRIPQDTGP